MTTRSRLRDILQMLTIDDVARKLNMPASEIRILVDSNALPHYRLGHHGEQIRIIQCHLADFDKNAEASRNTSGA